MLKVFYILFFALYIILFVDDTILNAQKIKKVDLPKPVLNALFEYYPSAIINNIWKARSDEGEIVYEIEMTEGCKQSIVQFMPNGRIHIIRERIKEKDILHPIREYCNNFYKSYHIVYCEKKIKNRDTTFQVALYNNNTPLNLTFDAKGKALLVTK